MTASDVVIEISDHRGVRRVPLAEEEKRWSALLVAQVKALSIGQVLTLGPTKITRIS